MDIAMNQGQLNRLWLTESGSGSLPDIGVEGLTRRVVCNSATLQTMLVVYSDVAGKMLNSATYIRKREGVGVNWELWNYCG